ncbi:RNA polymerase factor sigma-54 [Alkalispirochaeta americana]|nr:RNA polymerase factor sigma-54 [Alkalispirochaeta americana]
MSSMQFQKPALSQRQEMRLTPQLLQSIQLMTLPLQELQLRVQEELETNPALELVSEAPSLSLNERDDSGDDYDYFENSSDPGYSPGASFQGDEEGKRNFLEGALSRPESLHEHLLWQLRLQPISEREFRVGELLILNLDDNGFHQEPPDLLVSDDDRPLLKPLMDTIRTFEPVGCCTADFRESLLVQAGLMVDPPPKLQEIVGNHLEKLERGHHHEVAQALAISLEEVQEALEALRSLTPYPGRMFSSDAAGYVIPDLLLKREEGQFLLVLNDEQIPVLGVNPFFSRVATGDNREARKFAGRGVREAQWFIQGIQQRNETLLRVARAILEFQRDFFLKGKKHLVPLTLKDIAFELNVSESTVSRITNGKYIQTEWGIFELKHFFSNRVAGAGPGGAQYSKEGVKEIIREILEEQDSQGKRFSDQKLADLLAQRGIKIARRTVAKYRSELKISSSYER